MDDLISRLSEAKEARAMLQWHVDRIGPLAPHTEAVIAHSRELAPTVFAILKAKEGGE